MLVQVLRTRVILPLPHRNLSSMVVQTTTKLWCATSPPDRKMGEFQPYILVQDPKPLHFLSFQLVNLNFIQVNRQPKIASNHINMTVNKTSRKKMHWWIYETIIEPTEGQAKNILCYWHVGETGVVDANLEGSRHQVLLFQALFFYSP